MTDARATRRPATSLAPNLYERGLSAGAALLLCAVVVALLRGRGEWGAVPPLVWAHLATIIVALALTPVLLLRPRGVREHRRLGRLWAVAMLLTAALSLGIRRDDGSMSAIHILSGATLLLVPRLWWTARTHRVVAHRRTVRALVTGALLIAGAFTFPFDRLLGHWLFS